MTRKSGKHPFAKRSLGQNFLVDEGYIAKIIGAMELTDTDTVIEIGAGRGALTAMLLDRAGSVFAIEFDRDLAPDLQAEFGPHSNFNLIQADALTTDFAAAMGIKKPAGTVKLVANLPYNISTAILQRLIEQRELFSTLVLMFQREVVERIMASPGNSCRGYLTVLAEAAFDRESLFDVPGTAFLPRPNVWSSVIRLTPKSLSFADDPGFHRFIGLAFAQKRKTLSNNLKHQFEHATSLIAASGIDGSRRAETLTVDEWGQLYRSFS